jgi:hypothetical protein
MDITEIQPIFDAGAHVTICNSSRQKLKKIGELELAESTGVVLETTINTNGEPVYLLLLSYGECRKVAQTHLERV